MKPVISMIVAVADDNAIGRDGNQPFFVSDDLRHFKELTMGHPIIMGRKTFQALPKGALPGRRNIVVTGNPDFKAENVEVAPSIEAALKMVENTDESFVIGGASIYKQALPVASKLYVTRIYAYADGADVFFPELGSEWICEKEGIRKLDSKSGLEYSFLEFSR